LCVKSNPAAIAFTARASTLGSRDIVGIALHV
jgi:hypothetical protein